MPGVREHLAREIVSRSGRVLRDLTRRADILVVGARADSLIDSGALPARLAEAHRRGKGIFSEAAFRRALAGSAPEPHGFPLATALTQSGATLEDALLLAGFDLVSVKREEYRDVAVLKAAAALRRDGCSSAQMIAFLYLGHHGRTADEACLGTSASCTPSVRPASRAAWRCSTAGPSAPRSRTHGGQRPSPARRGRVVRLPDRDTGGHHLLEGHVGPLDRRPPDLRPDLALLAAVGRGNVNGEPVQGTLADFMASEVNNALLSRTQIYELHEALVPPTSRRCCGARSSATKVANNACARRGDRVPRRPRRRRRPHGAHALELATATAIGEAVTLEDDAEDALQRKAVRYDKAGDQHYDFDLRLDQGHARLGPRRLALLPGRRC